MHDLQLRHAALRAEQPALRARDAARILGVSEAEVVAASDDAHRLRSDWAELFRAFPSLGPVMALTRNETAVHERRGTYGDVRVEPGAAMGMVVGPDIDLRMFFSAWNAAFAVSEPGERGTRRSVQVFDHQGTAVHKVHLDERSSIDAFDRLVLDFAEEAPLAVRPAAAPAPELPDREIDVAGLRAGWAAMQDTHEFHGLLRRFEVGRIQALRHAGPFARRVGVGALTAALDAAADQVPLMVFVGNHGCLQIHSGPISVVRPTRGWTNVLDRTFNLHVRDERLREAWIVQKPTSDGAVTSLEVYDVDGHLAVQLFGVRKPGRAEDARWTALLAAL